MWQVDGTMRSLTSIFFVLGTCFLFPAYAGDEPAKEKPGEVEKAIDKTGKWTKDRVKDLKHETRDVLDTVEKKMKKTKKKVEPEIEEMLDDVQDMLEKLKKKLTED